MSSFARYALAWIVCSSAWPVLAAEEDTVDSTPTTARAADGSYIAWREHISDDPKRWDLSTLASGPEAAAAEDVGIADANGDGYPDVVVACELAHFFADFDGSGRPTVVAANKGGQNPAMETIERDNISFYLLPDDPLDGGRWREQVLGKVRIPINSQPVDLDGGGDLDVVGGSRGERRILWFENEGGLRFEEHAIDLVGATGEGRRLTGFNMDYADLDGDGDQDVFRGRVQPRAACAGRSGNHRERSARPHRLV